LSSPVGFPAATCATSEVGGLHVEITRAGSAFVSRGQSLFDTPAIARAKGIERNQSDSALSENHRSGRKNVAIVVACRCRDAAYALHDVNDSCAHRVIGHASPEARTSLRGRDWRTNAPALVQVEDPSRHGHARGPRLRGERDHQCDLMEAAQILSTSRSTSGT